MIRNLTILAAAASLAILSLPAAGADLPGYDQFDVPAMHRARPLEAAIWYPAENATYRALVGDNAVFRGVPVYMGPAAQPGPHPLVIISHGSGGNIQNLGWLADGLVRHGAMVLGVNHPGTTSGDSSPRRTVRHWERPMDIDAALTEILNDSTFAPLIDEERISVVGFSLGGLTALSIAGARMNKESYVAYCQRYGVQAHDCLFLEKGGVDLGAVPTVDFERDLRDRRVSKAVAVDPGFTHGFTDEGLSGVEASVQLISFGSAEDRWVAADIGPSGSRLTQRLPDVRYDEIAPANHFAFLGLCKPEGPAMLREEGEDPICTDTEGADREEIHRKLIDLIAAFVVNGRN
ncbi:MAG: alpha/beta hydrolase family protein [Inquilinaceae bacterium]